MTARFLSSVCLLLLAGCASHPAQVGERAASPVELTATPFFPQRDYQCGPAALATVLVASGASVTPDELTQKVYLPGRKGSLQIELAAAARGYDRLAYRIEPRLDAIVTELEAGRPVLVLQNLGVKSIPVWHYAVVVGIDPQRKSVILRSGRTQRQSMSEKRFLRSWALADNWAVLTLKPGELPAQAQVDRYVEAVAGLETAGRYAAALSSYRAANERWPSNATALLGMSNVYYRQGNLSAAEDSLRRLIQIDPGHAIARNNLAQVLLDTGRPQDALEEIGRARAALSDSRFLPVLEETEQEIRRAFK